MVFSIDANGPFIDHPERDQWTPAMAGDATLIGPDPQHDLRDALWRWLEDHPDELDAIRRTRPQGPLAVSYVTRRGQRPCRYDHVYVTNDFIVNDIDYRAPHASGSDHGAILTTLTLRHPRLR